jgi:hypothetical protein
MILNVCSQDSIDLLDMKRTVVTLLFVFAGIIWTTNQFMCKLSKEPEEKIDYPEEDINDSENVEEEIDNPKQDINDSENEEETHSSQETADCNKRVTSRINHISYHLSMIQDLLSEMNELTSST